MSMLQRMLLWLCDKFDVPATQMPRPKLSGFVRQTAEERVEERIMAKLDMAVMEVELPDASAARNVDLQQLSVKFADPKYAMYEQNIVLAVTDRIARYRVPEGSVYTLTLGYVDEQNDGTQQISWSAGVTLAHEDTLAPDAPGPFGEIRMVDEFQEDLPEDPVIDPVTDPVAEEGEGESEGGDTEGTDTTEGGSV